MTAVRRRLAWLAACWVTLQVVGIGATPVIAWRVSLSHGDQECDCPIDAGAACPMHHQSQQDGTCKLRNAFGDSHHAFFELSGACGVLPATTISVTVFDSGVPVHAFFTDLGSLTSSPDYPPPRA